MTMSERILIMVKNKVVLKQIQKSLLKEKLSHDIITVNTEFQYENADK